MSPRTLSIAIVGANGQVGTEACLYLRQWPDVRPVAICRSNLAGAFLRRFGIECRTGNLQDARQAKDLLAGCDVVVDFSLPSGIFAEMQPTIRSMVTNCIQQAPEGAAFVYGSSEMAYGMRQLAGERFRWYRLSRTVYGASKRFGENLANQLGRRCGRPVYVLRLGQVHGELQNVTQHLLSTLRPVPAYIPDALSDTVFVFSIAEALAQIARGQERPGKYTLVSGPQWSWLDVYEYYAKRAGVDPQPVLCPPESNAVPAAARLASLFRSAAVDSRDIISGYLLRRLPDVQWKLACAYRARSAASQIAAGRRAMQYRPFGPFFGPVLGERLKTLSDSRVTMAAAERLVRETLAGALPAHSLCGS